jgi:hypothetical protein
MSLHLIRADACSATPWPGLAWPRARTQESSACITGRGVFGRLKFETGVHRVQRVPETETQGRTHTSTVTVAVLPVAQEVRYAQLPGPCYCPPPILEIHVAYSCVLCGDRPTFKSCPRTFAWTRSGRPAQAASTSTRRTAPCASLTCPPASPSPSRTNDLSTRHHTHNTQHTAHNTQHTTHVAHVFVLAWRPCRTRTGR